MYVCLCVCVYIYKYGTSATRARHDQQFSQHYSKWIKNHTLISSKHT